jgi:hypothetical protein
MAAVTNSSRAHMHYRPEKLQRIFMTLLNLEIYSWSAKIYKEFAQV